MGSTNAMVETERLIVSTSPHIKTKDSCPKIMWSVVIALIPAGVAGILIFGFSALKVISISLVSAILSEAIIQKLSHKKITIADGSCFITGLLLAYNLPPSVPWWIPAIGSFFAIAIAKQAFGGLGYNIFNPALAARAFLLASWPKYMTKWIPPRWYPDALSTATPLTVIKHHLVDAVSGATILNIVEEKKFMHTLAFYGKLFLGDRAGCIGEVCILAIISGGFFLLYKGYIRWYTPFTFIFTVGFLSWIFLGNGLFNGDWLFYILSGGLFLGAFFMATDYVTTPLTKKGQIIFGFGCGILTFLIRKFGGYPEGVSYSILIMNAFTPLIDRYTKTRKFGLVKKLKS
ncbi:MAG: RnfABCDGE type electron transport complex subunit D [Candidatus Omnitrophica bacterium]|nr:RnfABCDGE type electron transport complex subunit D [Candidatus Omnitrophota bacterium]MCM8793658.1 RnfABCDGE type electron transport complex subunit D [Candidatus Omnitrophota bacterium]